MVLLPQGRFAAFLQAPAAQRQELLQKLFGTQRFADVEAALKRRRDVLRTELDLLSSDLRAAVRCSATRHSRCLTRCLIGPVLDWARSRLVLLASEAETAEAVVERCSATEVETRTAVEEASRLAELKSRKAALLARQTALEAGSAAAAEVRTRLTAARAAAPLSLDVARLLALRSARPALLADVSSASAALAGWPGSPAEIERRALDQLAVVVPMLAVERDLVAREQALTVATATVQAAEQRHVAAEADLVELRARCGRLASSLASDEVAVAGLPRVAALHPRRASGPTALAELPAAEALALEAEAFLQSARAAAARRPRGVARPAHPTACGHRR